MQRALVIHDEYLNSYLNKNVGYFIQYLLSRGFQVQFLTLKGRGEPYDGRVGERFSLIELDAPSLDSAALMRYLVHSPGLYDYIWIYPFHRRLPLMCALLRLKSRNLIVKMDSHRMVDPGANALRRICGILNQLFLTACATKILVESSTVWSNFLVKHKLLRYSVGIPKNMIDLANRLGAEVTRQSIMLYAGRITPAKGVDRLVASFLQLHASGELSPDWRLRIIGKVIDEKYFRSIVRSIAESSYQHLVTFGEEKKGEAYLREILSASLIVLPTLGEGLPNLIGDCFFCKRVFLTTTGARCDELILDDDLYCRNSDGEFREALHRVATDIESYYERYDELYCRDGFIDTDDFFSRMMR
ncbi:MAG: glycosyltransferase [Deltaproteobacteria bacterium]|nr:glycosyltransferase [Deltaproteobacteria bacterium]